MGRNGAAAYFSMIAGLLDYENMSFSDYFVDVQERENGIRGGQGSLCVENNGEWVG